MKLTEDTSIRYHTKIDDRLGGPYHVEGLESLIYLKKINADTLICREGRDDFRPIKDSELAAQLYPQRAARPSAPQHWAPPGRPEDPHRQHYRFTEAKFEKVNGASAATPKVDVYEMLDEIRQAEIASGLDEVRPKRFKLSNRTKDFWFVFLIGNGTFLSAGVLLNNLVSTVFAFSGAVLFSTGLLWSMYGVMGKY